jgi:hypothetical protein
MRDRSRPFLPLALGSQRGAVTWSVPLVSFQGRYMSTVFLISYYLKSGVIIFVSQVLDTMAPSSVPNMDEATIRASNLPVMRTATHI